MTPDTLPAAPFDADQIADSLVVSWGLKADRITYLPKGMGSDHWLGDVAGAPMWFISIDDLDTKPWIGITREETAAGLDAAYEAARVLRDDCGLDLVVGPLPSAKGAVTVRLSDQHTLAVFPFVEGHVGTWGDSLTKADRDALLRELARLHAAKIPASAGLVRRPLDVPERHLLIAALDALDRPWNGGPLSEPAREALTARARDVRDWLTRFDELAGRVGGLEELAVATHGEPHPGNVIHSSLGLRLIDWDTVALSRPERDLWMLDDGSPGAFSAYEELTGSAISVDAVRFYRLAWSLSDIASFADMFRSAHRDTSWIRQKWRGFQRLLGGAPPDPYAMSPGRGEGPPEA